MKWGIVKTRRKYRFYHLWKMIEPKAYAAKPISCVSQCGLLANVADIDFTSKPDWDKYCTRCRRSESDGH